jgi:colicin import membrane protein
MQPATADHLSLAPPREPGAGRAMGLSLVAHLLLALALAWGVRWTQSDPQVAFNAELWSPTVQQAAPAAAEPPPPPPPEPQARPAPPPPPAAREPAQTQADIAIEKKRKLEEERKKAETLKAKAEKERTEKAEKEKIAKEKARKEEEARKLKEQKEREQAKVREQARKEAAAEAAQEKIRQEQLQRIQGMAGATGSPDARGTALRSAAPSSSYAGKIIEQIKNNTTFTDPSAGRPSVVVLVKTSSSGQILSRRVITPSGNKAWDEAVLRAVDKMGSVPRDVDGRIPEVLLQDGLEIKVTL